MYLYDEIIQWAEDRDILENSTFKAQVLYTCSEWFELEVALHQGDTEEVKDAIGDIYVTLVCSAQMIGLDLEEHIPAAVVDGETLTEEDYDTSHVTSNMFSAHQFLSRLTDSALKGRVPSLQVYCSLISCLSLMAAYCQTTFMDCVQQAYEEISGRTGKLVDGVFVKDEL